MKTFLAASTLMVLTSVIPMLAQKARCEGALKRAHTKLATLYENTTDSSGYSLRVAINATTRGATQPAPEQKFRMAATKRELLIESESVDSYQDDSVKLIVFKKENKIYVTPPSEHDAIAKYMENFVSIQRTFISHIEVVGCSIEKKKATIEAIVKNDTLGLQGIKTLKYLIVLGNDQLASIAMTFTETQPLQSYSIQYSDWVEEFKIPLSLRKHYRSIASLAHAGATKFASYTLIDTRKKQTDD